GGFGLQFDQTSGYYDNFGSFHLVGTVTNNGDQFLSISLVAGLYAGDGTVLDASTLSVPFYLGEGESAPFNFEYFSNVNGNSDEAEKLDSYTVQVDPYWTYEPGTEVVALETINDDNGNEGDGQWTFRGDVVNTSDQSLSSATVVVAVYDTEDNLVATQWVGVYPSGNAIAPGDTNSFEVALYLDPDLDTTDFNFQTLVQGYVQ
ncbi:MAG: FxLYD domain-containing protein, partial [Anaerolineales bacterium]